MSALTLVACGNKPDPVPPADGGAGDMMPGDDAQDPPAHDKIIFVYSSGLAVYYNFTTNELTLRNITDSYTLMAWFFSATDVDEVKPILKVIVNPADTHKETIVWKDEDFPIGIHFFILEKGEWWWIGTKGLFRPKGW